MLPRPPLRPVRARCVIHVQEPSLVWRIRRLRAAPQSWARGFPYFGEAADMLERWGLYSRSAFLRALNEHASLTLGDVLCHRLAGTDDARVLYLADLSCQRLHCLREH